MIHTDNIDTQFSRLTKSIQSYSRLRNALYIAGIVLVAIQLIGLIILFVL